MYKKVSISLIFMLIAAMLSSSLALAADQPASTVTWPGSYFGQVFSISKDSFTLKNGGGREKTVVVSLSTRFVKINGDPKAFNNMGEGAWALAFGTITKSTELDAKVVVLAPRRFNKGDWSGNRQYGRVLSVDTAKNTLRVSSPSGFLTFTVDNDTHYVGSMKGLISIQAGNTVFIGYRQDASGALLVKALIAVP